MSLQNYSEYIDSGIKWIGLMPAHWSVQRYKQIFKEREERSESGNETLLSVSAYTGVSPRSELIDDGDHLSRAESLEGYRICHPNDLVVNTMLAWNRGLGVSKHHGIVSPAYAVYEPLQGNIPRYLDYMVRSDKVTLYYKSFSSGVIDSRLRLYPDTFGSLYCLLPPIEEQKSIAAFLDHETAKIDALIAEQEKLIALLAEKRQATISHAVTRGLNPDVPMKDSGVAWLGEVPAHWEVMTFQRCVYVQEGQVNPEDEPYSSMVLIAPNHIESGTGRLIETETAKEQAAESGKYLCKKGDVIYSKIRPALRKVCLAPEDCLCSADMYPMRGSSKLSNAFLMWFMLSEPFSALTVLESERVAMPKINRESLKAVWLPVPTAHEQAEIVDYLAEETAKLDSLRTESEGVIALLKERRSALIAAAVTGQIDVRNFLAEAS